MDDLTWPAESAILVVESITEASAYPEFGAEEVYSAAYLAKPGAQIRPCRVAYITALALHTQAGRRARARLERILDDVLVVDRYEDDTEMEWLP